MITQQIKLNLIPGQVLPRFNVSQYDKDSRTLQFRLYNGDQAFTIPTGMTAQISGTKPDNRGFAYTVASATAGDNLIIADLEQQMTAVAGEVKCELVLKQNAQRLGTCNFIIFVENAALSDEADISETELPAIIEEATAQMEAAAQSASEAASSAQAAEESADKAEAYGTHLPYIGANGNWFVYNVTTQQYEDSGVKAQGPLSGLTDVEITNAQDGQEITYDGTTQKWKNTSKIQTLTNQVSAINTQLSQLDFDGAGAHNSIYRGKYLGAEVTAEQYAHISDGTFKDMYIGDYWTIGGVNYRIGHFDYWLRTGDTECTTHHVLLVPDTRLASGKMNSTNTTADGYVGSDLKTGANDNTALATAKNIITTAFGSAHILTHREYFTNAVADGKPSVGAWYDSDIDLMNENMVYGTNIFLPHPDGSTILRLHTIDKTQIKLFADKPDLITIRVYWWLRDVVLAAAFTAVASSGNADASNASNSCGVRPAFAIKA